MNTQGTVKRKIGGGYPVWHEVTSKYVGGATLGYIPAEGSIISEGTAFVVKDKIGMPIYFVRVSSAALKNATELKVDSIENHFVPSVGMKIIVNGQELEVSAVSDVVAGEVTLTVNALAADVAEGAYGYTSEIGGVAIDINNIKGVSLNDIYIKEGTESATVTIGDAGTIYADRAAYIPFDVWKNYLQTIKLIENI